MIMKNDPFINPSSLLSPSQAPRECQRANESLVTFSSVFKNTRQQQRLHGVSARARLCSRAWMNV